MNTDENEPYDVIGAVKKEVARLICGLDDAVGHSPKSGQTAMINVLDATSKLLRQLELLRTSLDNPSKF